MVLVCNNPGAADELLANFDFSIPAISLVRLARMHGRTNAESMVELREDAQYVAALHSISGLGLKSGDLPLA